MTYSDKLKDPRWQKKRLEIMLRDKFTCQLCSATTATLHVHHLAYEKGKEPWEYEEKMLVTICVGCHEEETFERRQFEEQLIQLLRKNGYSIYDLINILHRMPIKNYADQSFNFTLSWQESEQ